MTYPTGCVYEGGFENDVRCGQGALSFVVRARRAHA